jgi:hypothetical protein
MTTTFLNKIPVSLRSFCRRVALECGVMKYTTLLNNFGIAETATYRDWGVTETYFVTPSNTQSRSVTPINGNFLPLFPDRGCVEDQPQRVRSYLDRALTTSLSVKLSQGQSRSVNCNGLS